MAPKADWEKYDKKVTDEKEEKIVALDESDIQILKTYARLSAPPCLALATNTYCRAKDLIPFTSRRLKIKSRISKSA